MYYVYGIKSRINGRIYIGQTKGIEERIIAHNKGKVKSTKKDRPWKLYAMEVFGYRNEAMHIEWKLKCLKGARLRWLEKHIISNSTLSSNEKRHISKGLYET